MRLSVSGFLAVFASACTRTPPPTGRAAPPANAEDRSARADAEASAGPAVYPGDPPLPAQAVACEDALPSVACVRFAGVEDAVRWVLAFEPTILAIGEAHAQKESQGTASSTKRFTDTLLPILAPRASDIVVELWAPDPRCRQEVQQVRSAQRVVTTAQAATNTDEYVTLGTRAKERGMMPWLLRPTCDDFAALADAGQDAIGAMLGLVKRLTLSKVTALHDKNRLAADRKVVLAYGGALHNDLAPPDSTKEYSFGRELAALPGARYVELDLIVPEFVKDTEAWQKLGWYASFRAAPPPAGRATLYRTGERSFTVLFPPSGRGDAG
jgi:hypothetical protein